MAGRLLARVMHPNMRWCNDHLRFRSVCLGWIEPDGERWIVRMMSRRGARVRSKDKAVRWLERWARFQMIRTPMPKIEVPGFGENWRDSAASPDSGNHEENGICSCPGRIGPLTQGWMPCRVHRAIPGRGIFSGRLANERWCSREREAAA